MTLYLIHAVLGTVAFLVVLGTFLGGVRRVQVQVSAAAVWLGLLWLVWNGWGRGAGLVAVVLSPLYAALSLPLAGPAARSLFGLEPAESGGGPPVRSAALQQVSAALAVHGPESPAAEALLDLCLADSAVGPVLARYGASREVLRDLLMLLFRTGAGRWTGEHYLAASALAYPPALELILAAGPGGMEDALLRIAPHLEYGAPL